MTRELHLELLLGKCVFDASGDRVGRIEEVRAEQQGDDWVIVEYLIGLSATIKRLSAWHLGTALLGQLGARKLPSSYCISWDQLDLSDPDRPRLLCSIDALQPIAQPQEREH